MVSLCSVVCWPSGAEIMVALPLVDLSGALCSMTAIAVENGRFGLILLMSLPLWCSRNSGIRQTSYVFVTVV